MSRGSQRATATFEQSSERYAFHEKAGRSQVDSSLAWLNKVWFSRRVAAVAMLPSALSRSDSFSLGACWAFSLQPVLPLIGALWFCSFRVEPGPGHSRSHRNSALGFCLFLPGTVLTLFLSCSTQLPQLSFGGCCATVRTLLRSPTDDAATPPAFLPSPRWLASSRLFHRAPPASVPSA